MIKGKKMIKEIIYRVSSKEEKELLPYVQKAEVISFDVFDTLIKRDVANSADVFTMMEQMLLDEGKPFARGFAQLRKNAEQEAKVNMANREITIKDIYDRIPIGDIDKQETIQLEYRLETELSVPNLPIQRLYRECVKRNITIIFISDMYLPTNVIQKILEKNGYRSGKLYVSSDCGCTKRSGKVFSYIQQREV